MNKKYNEQCDLIDELQNERKILRKKITNLKNDKLDDKYIIRVLKEKLKILTTAQNRTRNVRESIIFSYASSSSLVNHIAEMTTDINAIDQLEKIKRLIVISNSTIFIEDKIKFEHWLSAMQSKLETNENWYFIERMTMIYVNIKLNDEVYKHIAIQLNKNFSRQYLTINEIFDDLKRVYVDLNKIFSRQYLTINEIFDDLKRVYVDLNKMQIVMNAFIKLV